MEFTNREGYRYESAPVVNGAPPYPPDLVAKSRNFLNATLGIFGSLGHHAGFASRAFERYPDHARRAEVAATVVGVPPVDVLAANLCYDVLMGTAAMGCSTLALAGPDGPVLARNMDWFPAEKIAKASCLVHEGYGVNAGFVGMLGSVTGMSRRGFCVCLNTAFGGSDPDGYPVLLFLRHVLDTAPGYAEAVAMVEGERLMSGCIVTIVGSRNDERIIVERSPTRATTRVSLSGEPLMATNHFRNLSGPETCTRYEYMSQNVGRVAPAELLTSRHVLQEITAQHVVMCPTTQSAEMFVPSHLLPEDVREEMTVADLYRFLG